MSDKLEIFSPLIGLFAFNRPDHFRLTLISLASNDLASMSDLKIFVDGPRNELDQEAQKQIFQISREFKIFNSIEVIMSPTNHGLSKSIISGVNKLLDYRDEIIVLEDDLVTDSFFLRYMTTNLALYRDEKEVASIHGYSYPINRILPQNFFIRGADCWGWGTWRRAWQNFESDGVSLYNRILKTGQMRNFNFNNAFPYMSMLKDQVAKKNDSWAILWYASAFTRNMLTLYPYPSLVDNIGVDGSGTHAKNIDTSFKNKLLDVERILDKIEVVESATARFEFELWFRNYMKTHLSRKGKISQLLMNQEFLKVNKHF